MDLSDYKIKKGRRVGADKELVNYVLNNISSTLPYAAWVNRINKSKKSPNEILDIVDKVKNSPSITNKAGYIWRSL